VVAGLHIGDALSNRLDVAGALVSEDNGEGTLRILARESVGIGMADTSVVNLNTDFVCSGGKNLDLLNGEVLTSLPGDCGLAGNSLSDSVCGNCECALN